MQRFLVMAVMLCSSLSWAGRMVPPDMTVAVLKQVSDPDVVLADDGVSWLKVLSLGLLSSSTRFQMIEGVRVKDENNRFIVKGRLSQQLGKPVAVRLGSDNRVHELWLLSDAEVAALRARAARQK